MRNLKNVVLRTITNNLKKFSTAALYFPEYREDSGGRFSQDNSLWDMIVTVLELSQWDASYDAEECTPKTSCDKWRSSYDIWRHIKFFRPEISLCEVLKCMKEHELELVGQYCTDIYFMTFRLKSQRPSAYLFSTEETSEYGITFDEWGEL